MEEHMTLARNNPHALVHKRDVSPLAWALGVNTDPTLLPNVPSQKKNQAFYEALVSLDPLWYRKVPDVHRTDEMEAEFKAASARHGEPLYRLVLAACGLEEKVDNGKLARSEFDAALAKIDQVLQKSTAQLNSFTDSATPLHTACDSAAPEVLGVLLSYKPDPLLANPQGETPLRRLYGHGMTVSSANRAKRCAESLIAYLRANGLEDPTEPRMRPGDFIPFVGEWVKGFGTVGRVTKYDGQRVEVNECDSDMTINAHCHDFVCASEAEVKLARALRHLAMLQANAAQKDDQTEHLEREAALKDEEARAAWKAANDAMDAAEAMRIKANDATEVARNATDAAEAVRQRLREAQAEHALEIRKAQEAVDKAKADAERSAGAEAIQDGPIPLDLDSDDDDGAVAMPRGDAGEASSAPIDGNQRKKKRVIPAEEESEDELPLPKNKKKKQSVSRESSDSDDEGGAPLPSDSRPLRNYSTRYDNKNKDKSTAAMEISNAGELLTKLFKLANDPAAKEAERERAQKKLDGKLKGTGASLDVLEALKKTQQKSGGTPAMIAVLLLKNGEPLQQKALWMVRLGTAISYHFFVESYTNLTKDTMGKKKISTCFIGENDAVNAAAAAYHSTFRWICDNAPGPLVSSATSFAQGFVDKYCDICKRMYDEAKKAARAQECTALVIKSSEAMIEQAKRHFHIRLSKAPPMTGSKRDHAAYAAGQCAASAQADKDTKKRALGY